MDPQRWTLTTAPCRKVAIVGSTHGNEFNGVYMAKMFQKQPELVQRPSLTTTVVLSNEPAFRQNTRYVEEDLNRCFLLKDLRDTERNTLEAKRARELNALLGPKDSLDPGADFVMDLHTTTAATGIALMMAPNDDFAHEVGRYLMTLDPDVRIVNWAADVEDWPLLPTLGRSGLTFEVGPCPWGCLVGSIFNRSRVLLLKALDFIEERNQRLLVLPDPTRAPLQTVSVSTFQRVASMDFPRDADGDLSAMIHPDLDGRDFHALAPGAPAFLTLAGEAVPFSPPAAAQGVVDVFPFFINEASYYEKGVAFMLARRGQRDIPALQPL